MKDYTPIRASHELFSGFEIRLDNIGITTLSKEDIVDMLQSELCFVFKQLNMDILEEKARNITFHIHQEIIPGNTVYVCDCEKCEK